MRQSARRQALWYARCLAIASIASNCPASQAAPTYTQNVQPIIATRCVGCHQPGAIAPMAFLTYRDTRPWGRAIRQAVLQRSMPPWDAEPNPAHEFRNNRALSEAEIKTLVEWVDAACPEGSPSIPLKPAVAAVGWKLGTPDVVVEVPGFAIPATGQLPYSFLITPLHLEHDTWIRAAEFQVDQAASVHHMNAFVRPPGSSYLAGEPTDQIFTPTLAERARRREGERVFDRRQMLLGYEPGYQPMAWLPEGGKLLPAGSDLVFELHYNPSGKAAVDHSKLGLYFAPAVPKYRVLAIDTLRDLDLDIPPGEGRYVSHAGFTLGTAVELLSVQPHMHRRGASMEVQAILPDGRVEPLVKVPHYDFNWQTTYVYREPLHFPAGTKLESRATFDNSANNKFNPNALVAVHWGDQTTDEMHIAFLELVMDATADPEKVLVEKPRMIGTPASK
jgi:mono/diheme cytochrome c family protein